MGFARFASANGFWHPRTMLARLRPDRAACIGCRRSIIALRASLNGHRLSLNDCFEGHLSLVRLGDGTGAVDRHTVLG